MTQENQEKRGREEEGKISDDTSSQIPPTKKLKPEKDSESAISKHDEQRDIASGKLSKKGNAAEEKEDNMTNASNATNDGSEEAARDETDEMKSEVTQKSDEPTESIETEDSLDKVEKIKDEGNETGKSNSAELENSVDPAAEKNELSEASTTEETATAIATATAITPVVSDAVSAISGIPVTTADTVAGSKAVDLNVINPEAMVEERQEISAQYIGRVIGKGGEMIRDLQARSGCRMDVDQNVPHGNPRILTYRGTRKTVDLGKHMVSMLCTPQGSEANLPLGEATRKDLNVPASSVGKIIGRGGEMIRELQSRSLAKIQVDHTARAFKSEIRSVSITGTPEAVVKAEEMVLFLVANPLLDAMKAIQMLADDKAHKGGKWGSGPPYLNMPNQGQNMTPVDSGYTGQSSHYQYGGYQSNATTNQGYAQNQQNAYIGGGYLGGTETEVYPTAKMYMGRIIGQKGVTINDLQKRSGCDIQINQDVPPGHDCLITIKGTRQGIETAKQMLREVIEMGPNHPYAGGGGQFRMNNNQSYSNQFQFGHMQHQPPQIHSGYQAAHDHQIYGQQQTYAHQPAQQQYGLQPIQQQYAMPPYQTGYTPPQQVPQQQHRMPQAYGVPPPRQQPQQQIPLGSGAPSWKTATAADGQVYYYNEKTGETQWDKPAGMP